MIEGSERRVGKPVLRRQVLRPISPARLVRCFTDRWSNHPRHTPPEAAGLFECGVKHRFGWAVQAFHSATFSRSIRRPHGFTALCGAADHAATLPERRVPVAISHPGAHRRPLSRAHAHSHRHRQNRRLVSAPPFAPRPAASARPDIWEAAQRTSYRGFGRPTASGGPACPAHLRGPLVLLRALLPLCAHGLLLLEGRPLCFALLVSGQGGWVSATATATASTFAFLALEGLLGEGGRLASLTLTRSLTTLSLAPNVLAALAAAFPARSHGQGITRDGHIVCVFLARRGWLWAWLQLRLCGRWQL